MMSSFIGAIDQGTTSTRFIIFTKQGTMLSSYQKEHRQIYPKPGWVEHDPLEIWERTQEVIKRGLEFASIEANQLAAVGITNQRETAVVWDRRTGKPYHNAIVWQDTRTAEICKQIGGDTGQDRFRAKTGLPLATYFSGPKVKWMLDHVEGLRADAQAGHALFGTIDTWLIWNLTGEHVIDVTNASRTLLMDLAALSWDQQLLAEMGIPAQMLPEIRPSSDPGFYGMTRRDGPFGTGIPVCGDLGDQQAALYGQTCFSPGEAKNTYGTGCFMLMNTGTTIIPSNRGLLTTLGYQIGERKPIYALEGSIAVTGALVQWLRDNLGIIKESPEVETLAASVEDNGGIYFVPAFSGLFAPYWRSDARGAIVGMTRYTNKGHVARAALEATAYQTREVLEAMNKDSGVELKALKVDGGMVVNQLLMQFQADMLGVPVVRPRINETTALGAAYAAGMAVGIWSDEKELRQNWQVEQEWQPQMDSEQAKMLYHGWLKAVTRTFDWVD
ncbi:MAG: glycerol kinase GlpK [Anaerolineales bacterium]|nr:glycerol kinase GlpK [Anaerolineales bacterium]